MLDGMYFMRDLGDHYRTGKIIAADGAYLLEYDWDKVRTPLELVSLEELMAVSCEACRDKHFSLFRTRADLDAWDAWIGEPAEPVNSLVPLGTQAH